METQKLMEGIERVIRQAGEIMLHAHLNRSEIISKSGHKNFVTEYDRKVQEFLIRELSALHPEASFFAEEEKEHHEEILSHGDVFVIDPIDGTSNFMKGYYPSCISIGMLREGTPYLGLIYVPMSGDLFTAVRGCGARRNGAVIHASQDPLGENLAVFGTSAYYEREIVQKAYDTAMYYQQRCIDVRRSGSAAYDLCMVACGAAGVYAEPLIQLWDFAAGALIAQEAGATVSDYEGKLLTFRGSSGVVAVCPGGVGEDYLPFSGK
ncbi:MAG: inositol monophosphatase [Lachnospiraceae bacterium]|nr:inositol monophosphatase [Lachnospiraceae bacterium]